MEMSADTASARDRAGFWGLLGPALAWLVNVLAGYAFANAAARTSRSAPVYTVAAATFAVAVLCTLAAAGGLRARDGEEAASADRRRFLAWVGVFLGVLFSLAIAVQAVASAVLAP
jgi:hypothetical protein